MKRKVRKIRGKGEVKLVISQAVQMIQTNTSVNEQASCLPAGLSKDAVEQLLHGYLVDAEKDKGGPPELESKLNY